MASNTMQDVLAPLYDPLTAYTRVMKEAHDRYANFISTNATLQHERADNSPIFRESTAAAHATALHIHLWMAMRQATGHKVLRQALREAPEFHATGKYTKESGPTIIHSRAGILTEESGLLGYHGFQLGFTRDQWTWLTAGGKFNPWTNSNKNGRSPIKDPEAHDEKVEINRQKRDAAMGRVRTEAPRRAKKIAARRTRADVEPVVQAPPPTPRIDSFVGFCGQGPELAGAFHPDLAAPPIAPLQFTVNGPGAVVQYNAMDEGGFFFLDEAAEEAVVFGQATNQGAVQAPLNNVQYPYQGQTAGPVNDAPAYEQVTVEGSSKDPLNNVQHPIIGHTAVLPGYEGTVWLRTFKPQDNAGTPWVAGSAPHDEFLAPEPTAQYDESLNIDPALSMLDPRMPLPEEDWIVDLSDQAMSNMMLF